MSVRIWRSQEGHALRRRGLLGCLIDQRRDVLHAPESIRKARGHGWRNPHGLGMVGGVDAIETKVIE